MGTLNIENAKNIIELNEALNNYYDNFDGVGKPDDYVDLSNLPVFGAEPDDTSEIYSYDDNYFLMQGNGSQGGHFVLRERSDFE